MITEGYARWFSIPGALPDHVGPDDTNWYISAERFYQESLVEVPKLLAVAEEAREWRKRALLILETVKETKGAHELWALVADIAETSLAVTS